MNSIVEVAPAAALMSFIERAARDDGFNIDKFESLLRMQREVAQEQSRQAFNTALAAVAEELRPVTRDKPNPANRNKYATLEALDRNARPVYASHGFSVRFGTAPCPTPGQIRITCTVSHSAGYSEQSHLDAPADDGKGTRSGVQAVGSTVTYLRRYLLQMAFNLVTSDDLDDDDGEATKPKPQSGPPPRTQRDFLNELGPRLRECGNLDEVKAIKASADVRRALAAFQNGTLADLQRMLADAEAAHAPVEHPQQAPEAAAEGDGWPGSTP